jgi:phage shock protein PspC (stress-responsive transcriptional regulator)
VVPDGQAAAPSTKIRSMTEQRTEQTGSTPRLLRRRTSDRVLGGVASGLGDYFNVDPLLIRITFVGLMIFGGAGLVLYVLAWLLVPAESHDRSLLEDFLRRLGGGSGRTIGWIVFAIVAFVVIQAALRPGGYVAVGPGVDIDSSALLAVAVVVAGVWLLRRRGQAAAPTVVAADAAPVSATAPVVQGPPLPRSPLAWYVYAALLLAVGLLAIASQVAHRDVSPGQFFGVALTVMGIGLLVGAWWGRARILILWALLLLPVAVTASFITTPLEGGIGDRRFAPVTVAELQSEYRSLGGRITLDLTDLTTSQETFHIMASVAVGQLRVILPENASITLRTHVGAGDSVVLGEQEIGTSLDNRYVRHQLHATTYVLDLSTGIGEVYVSGPAGY